MEYILKTPTLKKKKWAPVGDWSWELGVFVEAKISPESNFCESKIMEMSHEKFQIPKFR